MSKAIKMILFFDMFPKFLNSWAIEKEMLSVVYYAITTWAHLTVSHFILQSNMFVGYISRRGFHCNTRKLLSVLTYDGNDRIVFFTPVPNFLCQKPFAQGSELCNENKCLSKILSSVSFSITNWWQVWQFSFYYIPIIKTVYTFVNSSSYDIIFKIWFGELPTLLYMGLMKVYVSVCVRVRVCACVRARLCVCVCVCSCMHLICFFPSPPSLFKNALFFRWGGGR